MTKNHLDSGGKRNNAWNNVVDFVFSHKRYVLTLFPIMLLSILLGSICSPLQKYGQTTFMILSITGAVLLLGLTIFMVIITKKKFKEANISANVYISIIFAYMFLAGLILMIFFKILSVFNQKSIFNITGLLSVIVILVYILSTVAAFYIDFGKIFKHKKKDK